MVNANVPQPADRVKAGKALQMRLDGHTYSQISEALGWSDESGARHTVTRLLDRTEAETCEEYRKIQTARLEALMRTYLPAAMTGNVDSARVVLATHDRLARLHGLDRPMELDVTTGGPTTTLEVIEAAVAQLAALEATP